MYKPSNKVKLKFRLSGEGQQKFTRADTLGEEYTAERIAEQIAQIQKAQAVMERLAEKKKPEKTVSKPKPMAEPKTDYVYTPPTDEELDKFFGVSSKASDEPVVTVSKPAESKSPEKKEDVWLEIRGMRDCDKMIADLEAGGITSLDDLKGFFWNIHHDDDHTAELTDLKKKYTAIDKLLVMIKQRSEHSAAYKEYQERSALSQKHFRKKNAAAINAYEEADKYVKEHIKDYYIDGRPPKRTELEAMSRKLKAEYSALVPEHNAFLLRKQTAGQYTRTVRKYLDSQKQQERDRQYREKKLTQNRKKDTLE